MKKEQIFKLNCLRKDFMKWAKSNEPSTWELDVNEIGGRLSGFTPDDEPVIILIIDNKGGFGWYLSVNGDIDDSEINCYPIEHMTEEHIYEIRILVESWLAKKDIEFFDI